MNWSAVVACGVIMLPFTACAADTWRPYVCRVPDAAECEAGRKQIFPRPERYSDEATCMAEFPKVIMSDPQFDRLYPRTSEASESYLWGCAKE